MGGGGDPTEAHEYRKESHQCTDCPCCVLFLVSSVAWAGCYFYGNQNGDIRYMYHGLQTGPDGSTLVCGVGVLEQKPMLYYCAEGKSVLNSLIGQTVAKDSFQPLCVEACPDWNSQYAPAGCSTVGVINPIPYGTTEFLSRFCLPNMTDIPPGFPNTSELTNGQIGSEAAKYMESASSIGNAWPVLLGSFVFSIVLGYVYLILLRCCAKPLIWATMITAVVGFAGFGVFLFVNADSFKAQIEATEGPVPPSLTEHSANSARSLAVVCGVISALLLCVMFCFCKSIDTAAAVVKCACETIWDMPILLTSPLLKAGTKGVVYLVVMYGFLLCYATAEPVSHWSGNNGMSRTFEHTDQEKWVIGYYVFGSLWILCFLDAFFQFVVAYIVADYYYAPYEGEDKQEPEQCCALFEGVTLGLGKHAGSIAFGSLLIAIIMFVQKCLEYAEKKNKETADNHCVTCILGSLICCVGCCKEAIEFMNKNAYIDIAVSGKDGFCTAVQNAMKVMIDQGGAMLILNGTTFVFSLFGSMLIMLGTGAMTYFFVNQGEYDNMMGNNDKSAVSDKAVVVLVACIIAFGVSYCFMNVFDMTADTLLFCYGYDKMMNHYPVTAPPELRDLCDSADRGEHHS